MENRWDDATAEEYVRHYGERGINRDVALRVYTSRLLGRDPSLVLHGGGNTSVKTVMTDILGDEVEVLCVKGSGWDMAEIEPEGLPAVRLAPLRRLEALDDLSDEDMVNFQRAHLLNPRSPNPSVETLLHAFLPHKFVDHTHSNAVLALTDQPDGAAICRDVFGDRLALVPYIMPGFKLAKTAARIARENPDVEGMVLLKHGIFTFGPDARSAYDRMISYVQMAEDVLAKGTRSLVQAEWPGPFARGHEIAPILRGLIAAKVEGGDGLVKPFIFEHRDSPAVLEYVGGAELARYGRAGVATPDHVIRTKPKPLILPAPQAGKLDQFREAAEKALAEYIADYHDYFARNNARVGGIKTELDPFPRVILIPHIGLFGLGKSSKDARIAADVAEATMAVIRAAERIGRFESVSEADLFDVEYWSLEQAKLGKAVEKPLARQIVVVTGGGGAIGAATARAFAAEGAEVAVLDRDLDAARAVADSIGGLALACDVTDRDAVDEAFATVTARYGGVDIVVSNAGAAWQGRIGRCG